MAMGKPVIGANIGGIPELITDDTGWIFSSGNIGELASQMTHVQNLTNKTLADMGLNARHRVISKFNKHGYTAAINELYKSLGVRFDIKIGSTSP
jgi:glycosyltransferase involved in cell wall biosynthesis